MFRLLMSVNTFADEGINFSVCRTKLEQTEYVSWVTKNSPRSEVKSLGRKGKLVSGRLSLVGNY